MACFWGCLLACWWWWEEGKINQKGELVNIVVCDFLWASRCIKQKHYHRPHYYYFVHYEVYFIASSPAGWLKIVKEEKHECRMMIKFYVKIWELFDIKRKLRWNQSHNFFFSLLNSLKCDFLWLFFSKLMSAIFSGLR